MTEMRLVRTGFLVHRLFARIGHTAAATAIVALLALPRPAEANLIKGDFLTPGDGFLVTDIVTELQWLTPFYTRGHAFNDLFVQSLTSTYGFRYATAEETRAMLADNFGLQTTTFPGDAAGFTAAASYFDLFGVNVLGSVSGPEGRIAWPRSQGWTATAGIRPAAHLAFGVAQFGANGYMVLDNTLEDSTVASEVGSFLVRQAPVASVADPGSAIGLLTIGLAAVAATARRGSAKGRAKSSAA